MLKQRAPGTFQRKGEKLKHSFQNMLSMSPCWFSREAITIGHIFSSFPQGEKSKLLVFKEIYQVLDTCFFFGGGQGAKTLMGQCLGVREKKRSGPSGGLRSPGRLRGGGCRGRGLRSAALRGVHLRGLEPHEPPRLGKEIHGRRRRLHLGLSFCWVFLLGTHKKRGRSRKKTKSPLPDFILFKGQFEWQSGLRFVWPIHSGSALAKVDLNAGDSILGKSTSPLFGS